ncbi:fluoride efflux transporter FluC [Leucobacter chromiireducens]|uniref:fluoride efflux transporter FluC n=1 Tax=Leucobacter chromiireducens TaxID=283877 RepID=UPI003F7DD67C
MSDAASGIGARLRDVALVAFGGALGSLARFGVGEWLGVRDGWPIATLAVNILGAALLGLLVEVVAARPRWRRAQLLAGTGVLGGFTTYSLLATQLAEMLRSGTILLALGYASATVLGGLAASLVGIALGRALRGRRGEPGVVRGGGG